MYFVILDLEWNNTYGRKTKSFINEIIEIGAVMLDEELKEVSRYSSFIRSQIGKKLRGSVKELTHITNEDLDSGVPFTKALSELRRWIGTKDTVVITWGDGDIRVLIENYRYLNGIEIIPFLKNYADLQSYYHGVFNSSPSHQIGLAAAAQSLEISEEGFSLHRAIDDSILTAECFRRIYDRKKFDSYIRKCDKDFYGKLSFKPYVIGNINNQLVDKSKLRFTCECCGRPAERITEWRFTNRYFRAMFQCHDCDATYRVGVSFKKFYDRVEVKHTSLRVVEEKENVEENKNAE